MRKKLDRNLKLLGFVFGISSVFCAASVSAAEEGVPNPLIIAIQPTATPEKLSSQSKEIEEFLEQRLGTEVEIFFPTNYAGVVEALRFGHAHAAFMSAWPAAMAVGKADATIALAEVREVMIDGQPSEALYYFSHWVVLKDSPVTNLEDLRGRTVAFSSPFSTSGYVAPMSRLVELGYVKSQSGRPADPKDFFGEVRFSGGYAQAWEALKKGQADVAIIAGDVPTSLYREVLANTRIVETQGPIPSHAVVMSKDLTRPFKDRFISALLELGDPERRELMRRFVSGIFVRFERSGNQHIESLSSMLRQTGLEFRDKT